MAGLKSRPFKRGLNGIFLYGTTAGEQVEDENDDGEDDEDMNPSAEGVAADQAQQPEDEENDGDGPKHV